MKQAGDPSAEVASKGNVDSKTGAKKRKTKERGSRKGRPITAASGADGEEAAARPRACKEESDRR